MNRKAQAGLTSVATAPNADAQTRLLDAAERLFAEHSYHGISLRTITAEADVNIAAANYYFGSKEGLFRAVFERRLEPMNRQRREMLESCVVRAGGATPPAEDVIAAFLAPAIRISASPGSEMFRKLSGRASADPSPEVRRVVYSLYDPITQLFVDVLRRSCPHLTRKDLFWRLTCIYGAMMYVRADNGRLQRFFGDDLTTSDSEDTLRHIIPFLAAGLKLPSIG
jgi:AcrR family transcriptional regulator